MNPLAYLNRLKLALRGQLCAECHERGPDDVAKPPEATKCESDCTLFANLPRLARVASAGEPPCGFEVFTKSFQGLPAQGHQPDVVQALKILEAASESSPQNAEDQAIGTPSGEKIRELGNATE